MKLRLFIISGFLTLLILLFSIGAVGDIFRPFSGLEPKLKLLSYISYMMLTVSLVILIWVPIILFHQILHPERCKFSYHSNYLLMIKVGVAFGVLSLLSRAYLGYKIVHANYVECVNEANYSVRSSWRVYAKDINLCEQD